MCTFMHLCSCVFMHLCMLIHELYSHTYKWMPLFTRFDRALNQLQKYYNISSNCCSLYTHIMLQYMSSWGLTECMFRGLRGTRLHQKGSMEAHLHKCIPARARARVCVSVCVCVCMYTTLIHASSTSGAAVFGLRVTKRLLDDVLCLQPVHAR